jgi:hypothetical protein
VAIRTRAANREQLRRLSTNFGRSERAAQLPNAAVTRPLDGPELKLLCHLRRDGVTAVAVHFFQRRLSGAATSAPRRFVARVAARS